jgi:oxygen-independent coproporphyrinogen-3 oxidase
VAYREDLAIDYLDALGVELAGRLPSRARVRTVYIGGGTPTSLPAAQLARLLGLIASRADLSGLEEFTIEANPGTLDAGKIAVLKEFPVSRVSIGVQSFDGGKLGILGRSHGASETDDAFRMLAGAGMGNIGVDLIYGVPGENEAVWLEDLRRAAGFGPAHLSTYCLSVEPGTPLAGKILQGEVAGLPDAVQRELYYCAVEFLEARGYEQYEISNFARSGKRCRHNWATWRYEPYAGFGPAAVSFDGALRRRNPADLDRYCADPCAPAETEELSPAQRAREVMMLGLRTRGGISAREFTARCGSELDGMFGANIKSLLSRGFLERSRTGRIRLPKRLLFASDEVLCEFF